MNEKSWLDLLIGIALIIGAVALLEKNWLDFLVSITLTIVAVALGVAIMTWAHAA